MYEAKGLYKEALKAFRDALNIDPGHVPSLISTAVVLRRCSNQSNPAARSFLMDALRLDRSNASAWYYLGILHKAEGRMSEAAECFQAANILEESAPVEPFRWLECMTLQAFLWCHLTLDYSCIIWMCYWRPYRSIRNCTASRFGLLSVAVSWCPSLGFSSFFLLLG